MSYFYIFHVNYWFQWEFLGTINFYISNNLFMDEITHSLFPLTLLGIIYIFIKDIMKLLIKRTIVNQRFGI
jgi:hypothetical protein